MEEINDLIEKYGLDEDGEHVIVPFTDERGRAKRVFLLKRRYMRLVIGEDRYADYPLPEIIEATVKFPERRLTEVIHLFHKEEPEELTGVLDDAETPDEHREREE